MKIQDTRYKIQTAKGFTLLEVLLVVAIISILAGIVILAINPSKQLGDTRNANRRADVNTILNAVYQYSIDNNGALPGTNNTQADTKITTSPVEVCKSTIANATCHTDGPFVDLSDLTTNGKYLVAIPIDPGGSATSSTKYAVSKDANNRITVAATVTDNSAVISATR
jgi:type IV pilus assembly protein PilA